MAKYRLHAGLIYFRVIIVLLSNSVNGELVDFTCFNLVPVLARSVDNQFIGGYKGNEVASNDVSFGRTVRTGPGEANLPESCSCVYVNELSTYTRQHMECPSGSCSCPDSPGTADCLYRIGAFYCEIDLGATTERITTITLNEDATIVPEKQTITVNLGEPVTLSVSFPSGTISLLRWRKSSDLIDEWDDNPSPNIIAVTEEDAGVYECHEGGERGEGLHAILRLIVRGCAGGRWGPSCQNLCPVCYNGGMCDTESGKCICAPGFNGSNCHIAAGSNRWGLNGTLVCSSSTDRHAESCKGVLFCLQDPFGCVCAAGFHGINCKENCPSNKFGPYCSQTCHCNIGIDCLTDTGECNNPLCTAEYCPQQCATGWKGTNCQVPMPCPVGFYGEICAQVCNCMGNEQCDDSTGVCANGCQEGFIGPSCVEDGTRAITDVLQTDIPNAGQPVTITCEAVGNPLPDPSYIVLYDTDNTPISYSRTRVFDNLNSYKRTNEFDVDGTIATKGASFTCYVFSGANPADSQEFSLDVYTQPYLTSAPTVVARVEYPTQVTITWNPWSSVSGNGQGPVNRYVVYYRYTSDVDDASYDFSESAESTSYLVINGLDIDTEYDFVVVVVRDGIGGAGRPSPKTTVGTKCGTPTAAATVSLTTSSATELQLTWQLPPQSTWQCRSLDKIYIYRKLQSESSFGSAIGEYEADQTQAIISSLIPCTEYSVVITFNNRDGRSSPGSVMATETTDRAAPGPVQSLQVNQDTTGSDIQLRITWSAPTENNCPVENYIIQHSLARVLACDADIVSPRFEVQTASNQIMLAHLTNLLANSRYFVSVIARNSVGSSTYTPLYKTSSKKAPSFVPTVSVADSDVTSSSIRFTWNEYNCTELNGEFAFYSYTLTKIDQQHGGSVHSLNSARLTKYRLDACTTYRFKVAVKNDVGLGFYSDPIEVTTSSVVPNRVQALTVNSVQGYPTILSLQWSKPDGECPIDYYTISYRLSNAFQCEVISSAPRNTSGTTMDTMYNITGLLPYSLYYVYVTASTPAGEGSYSYYSDYTAEAAPSEPPVDVNNVQAVKRSLQFSWNPPPCRSRRGYITGYSYKLVNLDRDDNNITGNTQNSQVQIENLVPYTLYSFHVLARTAAGDGPYSDGVEVRTAEAKPSQVTMVSTPSGDATSITVEWHRPDPPHGIIIAYYILYSLVTEEGLGFPDQREKVTDGLDQRVLQLILTGLEPNANYSIKVQGETSISLGDPSTPVYRITKEGIPGPPSSLRIVNKQEKELEIEWSKPMVPNGRIINYIIKYRPSFKPYQLDYTPPEFTRLPVSNPNDYSRVLLGLEPGTQYEIEVSAETSVGEGDPVSITGFTQPMSDIANPEKPTLDSDKSTTTAVVISITELDNPFITSYMVWVKKVASRKRRQSGPNQQGESMGTFDENPDSYIAADIQKDDLTGDFEVGDNKTYNGYYNPPLEEGGQYEIRSGASSKADDAISMSWSSPLDVTVGEYNRVNTVGTEVPTEGANSIGTIVGIVISVLLILAAAGYLAMIVIKKRKSQGTARPFNSIGMRNIDRDTPKYTPAPTGPSKLKTVASEDALSNLNNKKPSEASIGTPEIQKKPPIKKANQTASVLAGPVKVEQLKSYIKRKRAKNNEGYKQDYGSLPDGQIHSWDVAREEENKVKNRYANIIAYDHSRVILDKLEGSDPHSDYINACYIDGYNHPNKYIASQGPNQTSTNDMWRMVWQEKTSIIVMVTHLEEGGKKKCAQYWPSASKHYGGIEVKLESESKLADYVTRTFTLKKEGETRKLTQFHFTSWPDMGLPKYVSPLLYFVYTVKASITPKTGPIIVHCSAGVGRTGTFITIDAMLDRAKSQGKIDVLKFVADMRDRRIKMIQTQEQYMFIFDALLEAFVFGQTWISVDDIKKEYDRLKTPSPHGNASILQDEFNKLTALQSPAKGDRYRGGQDPLNADKNRFPDCLPFDRCRPYLMTMGADHSTNYINASYINGYWKRDQYITTQLPLPNTSIDFWSMIYDYKSPTIVMLNPLDPNDQNVDRYWPEKSMGAFGPLNVHLVSADNEEGIESRTFTIDSMNKPNDKPHTVRQFDFQGWSLDEELPPSPVSLLQLIYCVTRWHEKSQGGPLTVQCIDGVRCCGVFCAIMTMLDRIKTEEKVDVFQAVRSVRNNRPSMVSSLEQYDFCYETALRHLQSFDIYENFK